MTEDTHFYVSSELSAVVDLVLRREKLLSTVVMSMHVGKGKLLTIDHQEAESLRLVTARLEKLVIKREPDEIH